MSRTWESVFFSVQNNEAEKVWFPASFWNSAHKAHFLRLFECMLAFREDRFSDERSGFSWPIHRSESFHPSRASRAPCPGNEKLPDQGHDA